MTPDELVGEVVSVKSLVSPSRDIYALTLTYKDGRVVTIKSWGDWGQESGLDITHDNPKT